MIAARSAADNVPVPSLTIIHISIITSGTTKVVVILPESAKLAKVSVIVPENAAVISVTFAIFPATSAVTLPVTVAFDAAESVTGSVINSDPIPLTAHFAGSLFQLSSLSQLLDLLRTMFRFHH